MKPATKPATGKPDSIDSHIEREPESQMPFRRINFILIAASVLMIIIGFLLMTGAPSTAEAFNPDIFSTRRIVIGPAIAFLGFIAMGIAIMWNGKSDKK